jgi:serine/threonine protein kinase
MHGTYGSVKIDRESGRAVKRTRLFEDTNVLVGCNLSEAAFAASIQRQSIENVIKVDGVKVDPSTLEICIAMERGVCSLHDFIGRTPWSARMKALPEMLRHIVNGLHEMHAKRTAHCDLKPANIVLTSEGELKIIDFGSVRFVDRPGGGGDVLCTYAFCSPECLEDDASPTMACDAYSLGAILYYYIFRKYLFDTRVYTQKEDIRQLHKTNMIHIPNSCPPEVPDPFFTVMTMLLQPDPALRLTINDLHRSYNTNNIQKPPSPSPSPSFMHTGARASPEDLSTIALWGTYERDAAIEGMFDLCSKRGCLDAFALSVSIADRFVSKTGQVLDRSCIDACTIIAMNVLRPETVVILRKKVREALVEIVQALECRLHAKTYEDEILGEMGCIDYALLKDACKLGCGDMELASAMYQRIVCA